MLLSEGLNIDRKLRLMFFGSWQVTTLMTKRLLQGTAYAQQV